MKTFIFFSLFLGVCFGLPTISNRTNRIINGQIVDAWEYPYYVFLRSGRSSCGGSLIRPDMVLTAGHCLRNKQAASIKVYTCFSSINQTGPSISASWIKTHPKYETHPYFDVGVIKLQQSAPKGTCAKVVCLGDFAPKIGTRVRVVGYGFTTCKRVNYGKGCKYAISNRLRTTETSVLAYSGHVMIARNARSSACFGDSGGPITYNGRQVGVVSAVQRYCRGKNYYVRTDFQSEIFSSFLEQFLVECTDDDSDGGDDQSRTFQENPDDHLQ